MQLKLPTPCTGNITTPFARALLIAVVFIVGGCGVDGGTQTPRGDAQAGREALINAGCGSCHLVRGIDAANGRVGPPLENLARRSYLAGVLPNNFDNLVQWLRAPDEIVPGTAMPNTQLSDTEAENIAAYLMEN